MSSQSRALRTLCQNGFIFTQAGDKCVTRLATLGLLFQENLQGQLRRFDRQCHFPVFPVSHLGECDPLLKQRLLLQNHRSLQENHSSSQLSDCRSFAFRCNQMVSVEQNLRFLWSMKKDEDNIAEVDRQQVQRFAIYCSPDGSLNTFHWMQSQRYRLWRAVCIISFHVFIFSCLCSLIMISFPSSYPNFHPTLCSKKFVPKVINVNR